MTKLVEHRQDIVMRQQCRTTVARWQEVAHEIGHRERGARIEPLAADALVHPGATALVGTRVGVEIEAPYRLAGGALDFEESHVRMPHRRILTLTDADCEETFGYFKQSREHFRKREIRAQLFL